MAKAIVLTRTHLPALADPVELARIMIVAGCALSLVLAGAYLPF